MKWLMTAFIALAQKELNLQWFWMLFIVPFFSVKKTIDFI